ncbi:MAG: hypothetical protein ABI868_18260 [Acidobacteriota bacterium]
MTDQELRELVRAAVVRHMGADVAPPGPLPPAAGHASHGRLPLIPGGDSDGACLIEPAVRCTHCGFCQSYGH